MTACNSSSDLDYLDKLVDEHNNTYLCFIGKKSIGKFMLIVLLCLNKLNQIIKLLDLNLVIESGLQSTKIFLAKVTPKLGQEK